jgi:phage tail-like protein
MAGETSQAATPFAADFDKLGENRFTVVVAPKLQIGEFRECTGLSMEREILEYAAGGNNDFVYKLPGRIKYSNVVLKRGTTAQGQLLEWFREAQSGSMLRTVTVTLVDTTGTPARTWGFARAYPVKWVGPNLNAGSDSPATETLEIAHCGLEPVQ